MSFAQCTSSATLSLLVLLCATSTLLTADAQDASSREQCVRQARRQCKAYASCVYSLDENDQMDSKDRRDECEGVATRAVAEDSMNTSEGDILNGVDGDGSKASMESNNDMNGRKMGKVEEDDLDGVDSLGSEKPIAKKKPKAPMSSRPRQSNRLRRAQKESKSKSGTAEEEPRECLENFGDDIVDLTSELCLSWAYDLEGCHKLCHVSISIKDDQENELADAGTSGSRCPHSSECNEGLFCATECMDGVDCAEGMTVGNGFCQPCDLCTEDGLVFVAAPPPESCTSVCPAGKSIAQTISENDELSQDLSLLLQLVNDLDPNFDWDPDMDGYQWYRAGQQITLFAPNNKGIEGVDKDYDDVLVKYIRDATLWTPQLDDILKFHTLSSKYSSGDIEGMVETGGTPALNNELITFEDDKGKIKVKGAKVEEVDIEASSAYIHVIGELLLPPSAMNTIWDLISNRAELSGLKSLIESMSSSFQETIEDLLTQEGPLTCCFPNNDALEGIADVLPDGDEGETLLGGVLLSHILSINAHSHYLENGPVSMAPTLQEPETLTVRMNKAKGTVKVLLDRESVNDDAEVTVPNIIASNGIVHMIDQVLLPASLTDPI